eukprot:c21725_g2_i3 orf=23-541(-)
MKICVFGLVFVLSCFVELLQWDADGRFALASNDLTNDRKKIAFSPQPGRPYKDVCSRGLNLLTRPHSVTITEFGAIGDGVTLNTHAFQNAIFYLRSFADKGGAQLYVPAGRWLTGSFNLTSHLTLFLDKHAIILASEVPSLYTLFYSQFHVCVCRGGRLLLGICLYLSGLCY